MMTTIAFLVFLGFYCCYYASAKAVLLQNSALEILLKKNQKAAKTTGLIVLVIALLLSIIVIGVASGTFLFVISLMVFGSLIILLTPLRIVTFKSAFIVFALALFVELSKII